MKQMQAILNVERYELNEWKRRKSDKCTNKDIGIKVANCVVDGNNNNNKNKNSRPIVAAAAAAAAASTAAEH